MWLNDCLGTSPAIAAPVENTPLIGVYGMPMETGDMPLDKNVQNNKRPFNTSTPPRDGKLLRTSTEDIQVITLFVLCIISFGGNMIFPNYLMSNTMVVEIVMQTNTKLVYPL